MTAQVDSRPARTITLLDTFFNHRIMPLVTLDGAAADPLTSITGRGPSHTFRFVAPDEWLLSDQTALSPNRNENPVPVSLATLASVHRRPYSSLRNLLLSREDSERALHEVSADTLVVITTPPRFRAGNFLDSLLSWRQRKEKFCSQVVVATVLAVEYWAATGRREDVTKTAVDRVVDDVRFGFSGQEEVLFADRIYAGAVAVHAKDAEGLGYALNIALTDIQPRCGGVPVVVNCGGDGGGASWAAAAQLQEQRSAAVLRVLNGLMSSEETGAAPSTVCSDAKNRGQVWIVDCLSLTKAPGLLNGFSKTSSRVLHFVQSHPLRRLRGVGSAPSVSMTLIRKTAAHDPCAGVSPRNPPAQPGAARSSPEETGHERLLSSGAGDDDGGFEVEDDCSQQGSHCSCVRFLTDLPTYAGLGILGARIARSTAQAIALDIEDAYAEGLAFNFDWEVPVRAVAAPVRVKCQICAVEVEGEKAYRKYGFEYCSGACLAEHRRRDFAA